MTSVSQIKLYDGEEVDHTFRKVAHGYRRQYIDCSTSAEKLNHVDVADIQTEHYPIATAQNQVRNEQFIFIYLYRCRLKFFSASLRCQEMEIFIFDLIYCSFYIIENVTFVSIDFYIKMDNNLIFL